MGVIYKMKRVLICCGVQKYKDLFVEKFRDKNSGVRETLFLVQNEFDQAVRADDKRWLHTLLEIEHSLTEQDGKQFIFVFVSKKLTEYDKKAIEFLMQIAGGQTRLFVLHLDGEGSEKKMLDILDEEITIPTATNYDFVAKQDVEIWQDDTLSLNL